MFILAVILGILAVGLIVFGLTVNKVKRRAPGYAMAIAAMAPSVLKPDSDFSKRTFESAVEWLAIDRQEFVECINEVKESLGEILEMFGLSDRDASRILDDLIAVSQDPDYAEAV